MRVCEFWQSWCNAPWGIWGTKISSKTSTKIVMARTTQPFPIADAMFVSINSHSLLHSWGWRREGLWEISFHSGQGRVAPVQFSCGLCMERFPLFRFSVQMTPLGQERFLCSGVYLTKNSFGGSSFGFRLGSWTILSRHVQPLALQAVFSQEILSIV